MRSYAGYAGYITAVITVAGLTGATPARAQAPRGYDTLSASAVAESLKVFARLEQQTDASPNDAPAWFHRGMIALTLDQRVRMVTLPRPGKIDSLAMHHAALLAFQRAVALDGNNAAYWTWLGRFYITEGVMGAQEATALFKRAIALFRNAQDKTGMPDLLLEVGEGEWTAYNIFESRATPAFKDADRRDALEDTPGDKLAALNKGTTGASSTPLEALIAAEGSGRHQDHPQPVNAGGRNGPPQPDTVKSVVDGAFRMGTQAYGLPRILGGAMTSVLRVYGMPDNFEARGEDHYLAAKEYFEEAYTLAPTDNRAFRALARVHAQLDHWPQFRDLARDHVRRVPLDPWGWMALGLAEQRLKHTPDALIAFDSGLARMDPAVRAHLDRLDRVLRTRDSIGYVSGDSATRAKQAEFVWMLAQPLWSSGAEKPRVEFLARLTFAEFRWGEEWSSTMGADTPKGQLYVRYGPPDMKQDKFWLYNSGLIFGFLSWGRNGVLPADRGLNFRIKEWQPARWDNIAETTIDSMPVQIARFRVTTDSVDVYLATRAPVKSLDSVASTNTRPYANFWLSGLVTPDAFRDSLTLSGAGEMRWTRRLPVGPYYYRVEAIVPNTLRAGRAAASMMMGADTTTGFTMQGFAISDLIVATRAEARVDAPHRWSDIDVTPMLSSVASSSEVSLVWETYEVGRSGTSARYSVAIKMLRQTPQPTFGGQIGARIVRGITGAASVNRKENTEGVTFQFEREVPYSAIIVDDVTLSLAGTPPGDYVLRLEVTDRVTGRTTSRATEIVIHE